MSISNTISNAEYHSLQHISSTQFRCFVRDRVEHYERYIAGDDPVSESDAMILGTAYHAMLEGDEGAFVEMPREIKVRRGKAWDAFSEANQGKTIATIRQMDEVREMLSRVELHEEAKKIVTTPGQCEVSYCYEGTSESMPMKLRCRIDKQFDGGRFVVDYKSSRSASAREFAKSAWNFRYDMQQAFYEYVMALCGIEVEEFYFLVQKSSHPWTVGVFQLSEDWMQQTRDQCARKLDEFLECSRSGLWLPDFYGRLDVLECPRYAEFE